MNIFTTPGQVTVSCYKRLGPWLRQEVEALGFTVTAAHSTGLQITATGNDCIKLNLNLRTASQVLYSIKQFNAATPDELYTQLKDIAWEELIDYTGYFSVSSHVDNEHITTPLFANLKVKDAIADRITEKRGLRPNSGKENNKTVIHLYWRNDKAEIFIDTSGEKLVRHGYRKMPGNAPMLEALACGVIYASGYNFNSTFINPMCGSGTLAIEAALMATNRAPGLLRMNYGFMHIIGYNEEVFFAERRLLKEQVNKQFSQPIIASDISADAIAIAKKNAQTAGVESLIQFYVCDFADTPVPQENKGVVVFNPEYGERLGTHAKLEATYKRIGDYLKTNCKGYIGAVFTGNPDLAKKIGLKASRKTEFYNGRLDCRLLTYELYEGTRRTAEE